MTDPRSTSRDAALRAVRGPRIAIESVHPVVDDGRFAVKGIVDRPIEIEAFIFADGHDWLDGRLLWRMGSRDWQTEPLAFVGNDLWRAQLRPDRLGDGEFCIEAWFDPYASYRDEIKKKYDAHVLTDVDVKEVELFLQRTSSQAPADISGQLVRLIQRFNASSRDEQVALLVDAETAELVKRAEQHPFCTRSPVYPLDIDRPQAEFASWYELFPRSVTDDTQRHGTFRDVIKRLPDIAAMGFDVLYFTPIHPIGHTHRKGANNSLTANPDEPGSPYAIGDESGGHDAIHPQLGTLADFHALISAAHEYGMEIALDFAVQCSLDHPWLREHPGWFSWRPNGTIRHAENPPKKYEDIVNLDFYADGAIPDLWLALLEVVLHWVEQGVKQFRVDNPHTKPVPFWQWLIAEVRQRHPEVIFLSEAFTRPAMMDRLAKIGFDQSYSYFIWRNDKTELQTFFTELNQSPRREFYRPHFFVNTPDINPYFLQTSGRSGFLIRAALAAMGSGLWGMYSGFEICEALPVPGKEEYLNSEKYEIRPRDFNQEGHIVAEITQLNRIRRENPALQTHLGYQPYTVWNENIFYFGKRTPDRRNFILVAVSLDPVNAQEGHFELPLWELGLDDQADSYGEDLMTGHRWTWHGKVQWMRIEPWHLPFGIWRIRAEPWGTA